MIIRHPHPGVVVVASTVVAAAAAAAALLSVIHADLRSKLTTSCHDSALGPRTIGGKKYTLDGDPSVWVKEGNTASFPYLKGVWQDKAMVCADETRLNLPKRKGDGTDTNQYIYWWFRFSLKNE